MWPALVGLLFGALELVRLGLGNYTPSLRQLLEVLGIHSALGALLGLPVALLAALATRLLPAPATGRGSGWSPWLRQLTPVAPAFAVLFAMGALAINVLYLPARLSPASLAADLAMAAAAALAAAAWARRPAGGALDRGLVAVALIATGAIAIWVATPPAARAPTVRGAAGSGRPPNIFLVLLDTLRADHLGAYGYERQTSPRIDALAAEALVFERAYSTSNWTRPAVASLFTSTMPSRHGANEVNRRISPELPLLAESLAARQMAVGLFTFGANVEPSDGYDRGTDHFYTANSRPLTATTLFLRHLVLPLLPEVRSWLEGHRPASAEVGPETLTDRALEWVASVDPQRSVFAYVHYFGPHTPYDPPPPYAGAIGGRPPDPRLTEPPEDWAGEDALAPANRTQMINQYDEEILWHDAEVGRLFDGLKALGRLDHALFLITSDHGEGFGEHGVWAHTSGLFDEVVRIPLILWSTFDWGQPRRLGIHASLLDLAPTLAEVAGAPVPGSFDGGSLLAWLQAQREEQRTIFIENPKNDEIAVRTEEWVYFEGQTGSGEERWLYRAADAAQTENLVDRFPEVVEELRQLASARRKMDRSRAVEAVTMEIDPEREEQLRALGYLQ